VATSSSIRRYFRTPKGLVLIVLAILVALAAPSEGIALVAPGLVVAVTVAGLIDTVILRRKEKAWEFPDGAILTGLFVAMILSPQQPWYVVACTSAIAIVSKHIFRTRSANVFNPAALGLVATFYVFNTGQNWWGASPGAISLGLVVLFATGVFIADRVNKIPLALIFLGSYFLLFTITAYFGGARQFSEIFRPPDLQAAVFFAFFILTDPPTSPVRYSDQVICGVIVAVASYAVFELVGAAYYLLAGALVGNIWEAWRRWDQYLRRRLTDREVADREVAVGKALTG
jgi:Na+-translocating ferredoxin:NAD+ oxidoreductase RnfD subunit